MTSSPQDPPAAMPQATATPAIGSRCWRDRISDSTGAVVISAEHDGSETLLEIAYDEGGSGWWPLAALVLANAATAD